MVEENEVLSIYKDKSTSRQTHTVEFIIISNSTFQSWVRMFNLHPLLVFGVFPSRWDKAFPILVNGHCYLLRRGFTKWANQKSLWFRYSQVPMISMIQKHFKGHSLHSFTLSQSSQRLWIPHLPLYAKETMRHELCTLFPKDLWSRKRSKAKRSTFTLTCTVPMSFHLLSHR